MQKYFNIAGPCNEKSHYMLPALERNTAILPLIRQEQYFVIHAARQTGKTTLIKTLVNHLNAEEKYHALYCSLESAQVFTEPSVGIPEVLNILKTAIKYSKLPHRKDFAKEVDRKNITTLIRTALTDYCLLLEKPLIILFDEIDGLQNGTLITFLRQLRDGYVNRPEIPFPHSVALVGMRNVRDYKTKIREDRETLGSTSPFNIISKALTLRNFSIQEIAELYAQHTAVSGQSFSEEVVKKVHDYTDGQPWLVNAMAREIIDEILKGDYAKNIESELVDQAAQNIMLRRDTHIDSLLERLKEKRIRKVLEPIITGERYVIDFTDDDTEYCADLGLIKITKGEIKPANKIYKEVIIRTLSANIQSHLVKSVKNIWISPDNNLDMDALLKAFQQFWRENSSIWEEKYQYKEAAPHLILQAFLQRVINSGGTISREYAANKDRMDLCVRYNQCQYPIEIKIHYHSKTIPEGLIQLDGYMDTLGEKTGWLAVFDRRENRKWEDKIYWETVQQNDKTIHIVGL